jgi:hypothetical protein
VFRAVQWSGLSSSRVSYPKLARNDTARKRSRQPYVVQGRRGPIHVVGVPGPRHESAVAMGSLSGVQSQKTACQSHQRLLGRDCGPKLRLKPSRHRLPSRAIARVRDSFCACRGIPGLRAPDSPAAKGFLGVAEILPLDLAIAALNAHAQARFHLPTRVVRQMWPVHGVYER